MSALPANLHRHRTILFETAIILRGIPFVSETSIWAGFVAVRLVLLMKEIYKLIASNPTYTISYVGNPNWGCLAPYIEEEYTVMMNNKLFLEVNAAGRKFCIAWVQGFENDAYVNTFQRLLCEDGISCEVCGPFPHKWPRCFLP